MTGLKEKQRKRTASGLCCLWILLFCAFFCMLTVTTAARAADNTTEKTWEERLEQARKKYNGKTVNIYSKKNGWRRSGKLNVQFVYFSEPPYEYILIRDSLKITDEAEMQAILEVITGDERYSEELYGSISFMKAEWIAHNIAHSMATGTDTQRNLVQTIAGEGLSMVLDRSMELDMEPVAYLSQKELLVYQIVEFVYGLNAH